jgi:hypothetical protein
MTEITLRGVYQGSHPVVDNMVDKLSAGLPARIKLASTSE